MAYTKLKASSAHAVIEAPYDAVVVAHRSMATR